MPEWFIRKRSLSILENWERLSDERYGLLLHVAACGLSIEVNSITMFEQGLSLLFICTM